MSAKAGRSPVITGAGAHGSGLFLADARTCAVAATGLAGSGHRLPDQALDAPAWNALLTQARFHRITGLLAAAIDAGALAADADQREQAATAHASSMTLCLRLEADLLMATEALDDAGIDHCVLKGSSFARLDYPDPALRAFADVDLLVRSAQYDAAVGALAAAGYRRTHSEIRPGFDRRFGKGVTLSSTGRRQLDLHRTLVMGPFGLTIPLEDLWSSTVPYTVGDRTLRALDADHRFLHACYHAAIGNARTRIGPLRDLAGMLQRAADPVTPERVVAQAARWGGESVVARAVELAWEAFALESVPLAAWARAYAPGRSERRALRSYLDLDMGYAARSFTALRAIPGWRDKAAFALALSAPSRGYGAGRHRHRWARWRNAARQIVQLERRGGRR